MAAKASPEAEVSKAEVRSSIVENSGLKVPYVLMNALAAGVASYGLLANSPAVVIGAMIIAMLLGPIMGLALALVDGDSKLFRDALIAATVGAILVILIGFAIGILHSDLQVTNETLVRTKPNLLDLAIALFGGAAGAYATVSPKVSVGIVGVAISTALVPPLASCGICIAHGLYPQAMGAFILFATNLVAIQCASSVVLYFFGFHAITRRGEDDTKYVQRLVIDAAVLLGLGTFLYFQLVNTVGEQQFQRKVKDQLAHGLRQRPGAYLSSTSFVTQPDRYVVVAVVQTPNSITPAQTRVLQALLEPRNGKPVELHVRSLLTKETTAYGYLHELEPQATPIEVPKRADEEPTTRPDSVTPENGTYGPPPPDNPERKPTPNDGE